MVITLQQCHVCQYGICSASYHSKFMSSEIFTVNEYVLECGTKRTTKFLFDTYAA